jgi:hypothetical protein
VEREDARKMTAERTASPAQGSGRLRTKAFTIAAAQRAHVNDFAEADAVPFKTLPWLLIVPGIVLVVLAGIALVRRPS